MTHLYQMRWQRKQTENLVPQLAADKCFFSPIHENRNESCIHSWAVFFQMNMM